MSIFKLWPSRIVCIQYGLAAWQPVFQRSLWQTKSRVWESKLWGWQLTYLEIRMNFVSIGSKGLTGFKFHADSSSAFKTGDSWSEGFLPFEASQWQLTAALGEALLLLARMAETRSWWVARGGGDGPPRWPPPMTITDGVWTVHQHQSIYEHKYLCKAGLTYVHHYNRAIERTNLERCAYHFWAEYLFWLFVSVCSGKGKQHTYK